MAKLVKLLDGVWVDADDVLFVEVNKAHKFSKDDGPNRWLVRVGVRNDSRSTERAQSFDTVEDARNKANEIADLVNQNRTVGTTYADQERTTRYLADVYRTVQNKVVVEKPDA
jgi:hypothetical protein